MPPSSADIVRKFDRLDHPDGELQNQILEKLTEAKDEVLPLAHANLTFVTPRARRALLRWLAEHHTGATTLPLMRYVFDSRDLIEEMTGRVLAMGILLRQARTPASPEEVGRLRAFAEDMLEDGNDELRVFALRILAFTGNQSSISYIESCIGDREPEIRKAAQKSLDTIIASSDGSRQAVKSTERLLRELVEAIGPRQQQLVRQWRRHPKKSTIALELIRTHRVLRSQALQVLIEQPRAEVRAYLPSMVLDRGSESEDVTALALHLIGQVARGEVRNDEIQAIRAGLRDDDLLIRTAAVEAAGEMGLGQFFEPILKLTLSPDVHLVYAAAKSLHRLAPRHPSEAVGALMQSIEINERRRQEERSGIRANIVAHLQSALQKCTHPALLELIDVQRLAMRQVARGHRERAIRWTALKILDACIPERQTDSNRWHPDDIKTLMDYTDLSDSRETELLAALLVAFAPDQLPGLPAYARRIWQSGHVPLHESILPLLKRSAIEEATPFLVQIAEGEDPEAAQEAKEILRRDRNQVEFIDAEFIPASRTK